MKLHGVSMHSVLLLVGMTPTSVLSTTWDTTAETHVQQQYNKDEQANPQDVSNHAATRNLGMEEEDLTAVDPIPGEGGKKGDKGGCGDAEDGGGKGGKGMDSGGHRRNRRARKNLRFLSSGKRESDRGGATAVIEDGGDPDGLVVGVIGCAEAEFEEDGGFERGL